MNNKIKILYIDDEEINLELFEFNFSSKYDVITGCCGKKGLECLEKHPDVDVVISDMKMPGMDGLEFIRQAKARFKDIKYFILTGYDISQQIRNALDSHLILGYFQKPFDIHKIEKTIERATHDLLP